MTNGITYILSGVEKSLAFEWVIHDLNNRSVKLSFIILGSGGSPMTVFLTDKGIKYTIVPYKGKKSLLLAFFRVLQLLLADRPNAVHAHLFDASFIGLTAAKLLGIKKRITTRHHATLHHDYFPRAVRYDKWINWLATDIIAISDNVKEILLKRESVPASKVTMIHHGFDFSAFEAIDQQRIDRLKQKYGLQTAEGVIVGVVSRYTEWKGIQFVIPAIKGLLDYYPDLVLLLAGAKGDYAFQIKTMLKDLPDANYREIEFEEDIIGLYSLMNVYVHVPIDPYCEAFGQTYVESLAAKVPAVFTLSGVAREFIENRINALVVPFQSTDHIRDGIVEILDNESLRKRMTSNGFEEVRKRFDVVRMADSLQSIYSR